MVTIGAERKEKTGPKETKNTIMVSREEDTNADTHERKKEKREEEDEMETHSSLSHYHISIHRSSPALHHLPENTLFTRLPASHIRSPLSPPAPLTFFPWSSPYGLEDVMRDVRHRQGGQDQCPPGPLEVLRVLACRFGED